MRLNRQDSMRVDPAYEAALLRCGLNTVELALARVEGRVVAWSRTTDTLFITGCGCCPGFYLKRYFYPRWRNRLRGMMRGTLLGPHRAAAEYATLDEMRRIGVSVVRPVACGARRVGPLLSACFLITEAVPHARNLTTFARDVLSRRERLSPALQSAATKRLARQVALMHARGVRHGQLFWRNIVIRTDPLGEPEFFLLDARPRWSMLARLFRRSTCEADLAQLAVSAEPFASRAMAVRFLREYARVRGMTGDLRQTIRSVAGLTPRWRRHEQKRVHMNDLFDNWNRRLSLERATEACVAVEPPSGVGA